MVSRRASFRSVLLVAVLCLGAQLPGTAAAASETSSRYLHMSGWAVCEPAARQWVITWSVTNTSDVGGTIGNMRVNPAGHPLTNMPTEMAAGETVQGEQRIPADQYWADIAFDVNWHDGVVTYNHNWRTAIKMGCQAAA
jgi:hypothetical protein